MQWWCAALGETWTWNWRAYPGVWLFVIGVVALFRWIPGKGSWKQAKTGERVAFVVGVVVLWLSLDWPLGPIAAGYLASAHALQFLLVTMVAAPLILLGARTGTAENLPRRAIARFFPSTAGKFHTGVTMIVHPIVAVLIFNAIVAATHVPTVVDALMPTASGAFLVDLGWLAGGIIYWWPVIMPIPTYKVFGVPMKIVYLLLGTLFHTVIGMIMLSASTPLYGTYELAPPVFPIPPLADQQLAGGIMELGVFFAIVIAVGVIFFRWAERDERGLKPL